MDLVRAGAQRLHGHRFPPEGPGLDATGAAGPSKQNQGQPEAVSESSREGSLPEGRRHRRWLREARRGRVEPGLAKPDAPDMVKSLSGARRADTAAAHWGVANGQDRTVGDAIRGTLR